MRECAGTTARTPVRSRQVPPIPLGDPGIAIPIVIVAMVITHAWSFLDLAVFG
jgi:hypothetical protein